MKYELQDMRQKYTDEELLNDLRLVAQHLQKESLKQRDYCKENGAKYNIKTALKRYGDWATTLNAAGLSGEKSKKGIEFGEKNIPSSVLLNDLKRVATLNNNNNITINDYEKHGLYTAQTMHARFGSWNNAKKQAELEINLSNYTNDELFQNILDLWTALGRQPKYGEVISPNSKFNGSTYARRFGSWRSALEEFIKYINTDNNNEEVNSAIELIEIDVSTKKNEHKIEQIVNQKRTTRNINLRMRWNVLKRDNFTCIKCGRSPAKDLNTILHVDHIIPWSKGGETLIENLETLCQDCNLGKSNT